MIGHSTAGADVATPWHRDVVRRGVPVVALVITALAALADPAGWISLALLAGAACVFLLWALLPALPTLALTAGVLVLVMVAQLSGHLEPGMFLVSLLAGVVARWERSWWLVGIACVAAIASPAVLAALQPADARLAWTLWMIGVAFPAVIGLAVRRQEHLRAQLEAARRELDRRGVLEERRRIARDMHDLVGHGLGAVLVQLTSARHVLRRDPDAADEALASAEDVGRRSMAELRRTVGLLRSTNDAPAADSLPELADLAELVDATRRDGMTVEYHLAGDPRTVDAAVALALYRIAQESLLNAARLRTARPHHGHRRDHRQPRSARGGQRRSGRLARRGRPHPLRAARHAREGRGSGRGTTRGTDAAGLAGMRQRAHVGAPMNASAIRLALVDDQMIVRAGLARILGPEDGFDVIAECADGEQALDAAVQHRLDLLLMDVRMPRMDGVEATRRLRETADPPPVLVLTTFDEDEVLWGAIEAGANGFVLKDTGAAELIAAARAVAGGGAWFDPAVAERVLNAYRDAVAPARREARLLESLTDREHDVLRLLARGATNAEIAVEIHVSEATVKTHVGAIFSRLGVRDRAAAIVYAFDHGVVDPGTR